MRLKTPIWSLGLAASLFLLADRLSAEEAASTKGSEYLWEISKQHLKDPLDWPSIWRPTPQATDPGNMQGWRNDPGDAADETAKPSTNEKKEIDWRKNEERRTRNYLEKVGPLQPKPMLPMASDPAGFLGAVATTDNGPVKRYLSQAVVLTTPFLAAGVEGGGGYPHECRIRYNASNESEILQIFDEVTITAGSDVGVKPGDLFRTYEVGSSYKSFTTGRDLGRLVETTGIIKVIRVGPKSSVTRLVKCFGTISREARACPLVGPPEVTASGYAPVPDGKLSAQVVWVTEQQQFPQPFSFAIVDRGTSKGYKIGDMVLFYNRNEGRMTEKVLGNGLVVSVQEKSATILLKDIYPGIINRGDYTVVVQTTMM